MADVAPVDYVLPDEWDTDPVIARFKNKLGIEGQMIESYHPPYLYLASDIINDPENVLWGEGATYSIDRVENKLQGGI